VSTDDPSQRPKIPTSTPPDLWRALKLFAREKRRAPTPAENRLWRYLRNRQIAGAKFRRQHAVGRFIVDFYCVEHRLIVEVDGPVHEYTPEDDAIRQAYLESKGLRVLRVTNADVFRNLDGVLEVIRGLIDN
jgi:very-short-patch-repair endonuclease